MYRLRSIFLALACSLFVMHHVVPHVHEQAAGGEVLGTTAPATSQWLRVLSMVFQEDLGEHHLEQLSVNHDSPDFCLDPNPETTGFQAGRLVEIFTHAISAFIPAVPDCSVGLRAPPALNIA